LRRETRPKKKIAFAAKIIQVLLTHLGNPDIYPTLFSLSLTIMSDGVPLLSVPTERAGQIFGKQIRVKFFASNRPDRPLFGCSRGPGSSTGT
jgi:hypothetical protein